MLDPGDIRWQSRDAECEADRGRIAAVQKSKSADFSSSGSTLPGEQVEVTFQLGHRGRVGVGGHSSGTAFSVNGILQKGRLPLVFPPPLGRDLQKRTNRKKNLNVKLLLIQVEDGSRQSETGRSSSDTGKMLDSLVYSPFLVER